MEDLFDVWDIVSGHVQDNMQYYIIGAVIALPVLFFSRKWSVPLILYTVEICIYLMIMHTIVHVLVGLTGWFKENSSMRALRPDGRPADAVDWTTPLVKFWEREVYDPKWIVYMEAGLAILVVILVFKFRPMRTQKPKPRFAIDGSKKGESEADSQNVANKYGRRRYADEWAKEAAKSARDSKIRKS